MMLGTGSLWMWPAAILIRREIRRRKKKHRILFFYTELSVLIKKEKS